MARFSLIHISTPEVYGNISKKLIENENYNPTTPYAVSRVTADQYLKILSETKKIVDDDFVYTYARNYDCLWDNPSLTTTTTQINTKHKTGRYYSASLVNVESHLVHSIIGSKGCIHKALSKKYKWLHLHHPYSQLSIFY